jgi:pseudaminic acid synthase
MEIRIADRDLGKGHSCLMVAELSANHNHDLEVAKQTIAAASESGADAIKLQTYTPDTLTIDCEEEHFIIKEGLWKGRKLYDLYKEAYTPWEWHEELFATAKDLGLICFSTPFDSSAVDLLEDLDAPAYKIASFEIQDIPLLKYVASKGKPVIISTGIADQSDIELAVKTCFDEGNKNLILLKCTSAYPAPIEETNLLTIPELSRRFGVPSGLSDHTMGISSAIASVALGASLIEKHFILDRKLGGPDSSFSSEPDEFKEMVERVREVEKALGEISFSRSPSSSANRIFARSLFVVENIKKGEALTTENIRSIRPGFGLHPMHLDKIIGRHAKMDLKRGTPLEWDMIH